eukprot:COSAG06_NODE_20494_length_793_cov_1.867435_1_plen_111_part_10
MATLELCAFTMCDVALHLSHKGPKRSQLGRGCSPVWDCHRVQTRRERPQPRYIAAPGARHIVQEAERDRAVTTRGCQRLEPAERTRCGASTGCDSVGVAPDFNAAEDATPE